MKTKQKRIIEGVIYTMLTFIVAFIFQFNVVFFATFVGINAVIYVVIAYITYVYSENSFKESLRIPLFSFLAFFVDYNSYSNSEKANFWRKYQSPSGLVIIILVFADLVFIAVQLMYSLAFYNII